MALILALIGELMTIPIRQTPEQQAKRFSEDYAQALANDENCSPADYAPELFGYHIGSDTYGVRYNTFLTKFENCEFLLYFFLSLISPFAAAMMLGANFDHASSVSLKSCITNGDCEFVRFLGTGWLMILSIITADTFVRLVGRVTESRNRERDAIIAVWNANGGPHRQAMLKIRRERSAE